MTDVRFNLLKIKDQLKLPKELVDIPDIWLVVSTTTRGGFQTLPDDLKTQARKLGVYDYDYFEFVGDTVLDLIVVKNITSNPDAPTDPGKLSYLKSRLVKNSFLNCKMNEKKLCQDIIRYKGEIITEKKCADVFESIIGAMFMYLFPQYGYEGVDIIDDWLMDVWGFKRDMDKLIAGDVVRCDIGSPGMPRTKTEAKSIRAYSLAVKEKEREQKAQIMSRLEEEYASKFDEEYERLRDIYLAEKREMKEALREEILEDPNFRAEVEEEIKKELVKAARVRPVKAKTGRISSGTKTSGSKPWVKKRGNPRNSRLMKLLEKYSGSRKYEAHIFKSPNEEQDKYVIGIVPSDFTNIPPLSTVQGIPLIGIAEGRDKNETRAAAVENSIAYLENLNHR